jgi:hypothetical protein
LGAGDLAQGASNGSTYLEYLDVCKIYANLDNVDDFSLFNGGLDQGMDLSQLNINIDQRD